MRSLHAAAMELAPVVIRRSTDVVRHESILERVVGRGTNASVWIHPVDAAYFAGTTCVVHVLGRPISFITHNPTAVDPRTLAIRLDDLRSRRRELRARRSLHRRWELLLTAPSGVGDLRVLPIVDITSHFCAVRSSEGFPEGHLLQGIEIVGDRGVLRRCSGTVLESVPWVTATGVREFRLRLRLQKGGPAPQTDYDTVEDPNHVRRILELAALLNVSGTIDDAAFRFVATENDTILIDCELPQIGRSRRAFSFELFSVRYECFVRVIEHKARITRLSFPLFFKRRRRRAESRASIPQTEIEVAFTNPVSSTRDARRVLDLSQGGLRFQSFPEDILWPDLILRDAVLTHAQSEPIKLGDLNIRFLGEKDCRTAFVDTRTGHLDAVSRLLTRFRQPALEVHDGVNYPRQLKLYRESGLLLPYMEELLAAAPNANEAWQLAHAKGDICRTLARYERGVAVASVTGLMAWDNTWLGQHLAARRTRTGCTPGTLLMAFLDHVVLRPDCRWMAFFATVGNARMNQIHERFAGLTGTPDAMSRHRFHAWLLRKPTPAPENATMSVRPMKKGDVLLVERASARQMGDLVAAGLGLTVEGINVPEVQKRLNRYGLHRSRECRIISDRTLPRLASITERTTSAICLPGILNGTWLVPLHLDLDGTDRSPSRAAMHTAVSNLRLASDEPCRLVFTDASVPEAWMREWGLAPTFEAYVYVMNRAGLRRYAAHLAESYGELNAFRPAMTTVNVS